MNRRILLVDDEKDLLDSFRRQLRGKFEVETAISATEALSILTTSESFAVVVSDYQMPGMDGIKFLSEVAKICPKSTRVMLTGQADMETAIDAVNEGQIFRFLSKPCPEDIFIKSLNVGIDQYRLIMAEEELLEKTLSGSINVLMEILSLFNPAVFGRIMRIKSYINHIVTELKIPYAWQFELSSLLSMIGYVTVPINTINKMNLKTQLSQHEIEVVEKSSAVAKNLISSIPRLGSVARMIEYQGSLFSRVNDNENYDGEDLIALGGNLIQLAIDFENSFQWHGSIKDAVEELSKHQNIYYVDALKALESYPEVIINGNVRNAFVKELNTNMIINENIIDTSGELLAVRGQELTFTMLQKLQASAKIVGLNEPVSVIEKR